MTFSFCFTFSLSQEDTLKSHNRKDVHENSFDTRFFVEGKYGLGVNTGLWSSGAHRGFGASFGSKWHAKSSDEGEILYTIPWLSFMFRNTLFGWGDNYPIEFSSGGFGISFLSYFNKHNAFEYGFLIKPFFQTINTVSKKSITGGLKGSLDLRLYFQSFYVSLDTGVWMNIGYHYLLGANTNLRIGMRF